jgi:hypothetical protein
VDAMPWVLLPIRFHRFLFGWIIKSIQLDKEVEKSNIAEISMIKIHLLAVEKAVSSNASKINKNLLKIDMTHGKVLLTAL